METITVNHSLKDFRTLLKFCESNINNVEFEVSKIKLFDLQELMAIKLKGHLEELETLYAHRIYLYTEIEKLK